jgi:Sec-independent protein translocase protein TatA
MGKVTDRYGNGVADATVTLVDNNYKQVAKTKSDVNGDFEFVSISLDTETAKVLTSYTDDTGKTYTVQPEFSKWFQASGTQWILQNSTQITDYPPPSYGFVSGAIQTGTSSGDRTLDGVVYLSDGEVTYYKKSVKSSGTSGFLFYVEPGTYTIYAQHEENGMIYESQRKQITVAANMLSQVTPQIVVVSLNTPKSNPDPATLPTDDHYNKVNGTVETKDGKPYAGATVTLYERADNGSGYLAKTNYVTKTDDKGYFEFDYVGVTTDDNTMEIQGRKDIYVQIDYTDSSGQLQSTKSDTRQLYYPNMFIGVTGMEDTARNVMFGDKNGIIYLPFAMSGWVSLTSDPPGASVYVDNQPLMGSDGKQLVTPCTAYIAASTHNIKLSMEGYVDKVGTIEMVSNTMHDPVFMSLDRPVVPPIVTLIVAIIILLIVAVLIILLLASRREMLLAPFAGAIASFKKMQSDRKASKAIARTHKAEAVDQRRPDRQHGLADRLERAKEEVYSIEGQIESRVRREPAKRDTSRGQPAKGDYARSAPARGTPVKREAPRREYEESDFVDRGPAPEEYVASAAKKREGKKLFDIKGITNMPKKAKAYQTKERSEEKSPVVFASDMYKKPINDVERIPQEPAYTQRRENSYNESLPARDDRIRIPKTAPQRDGTNAVRDREKVLRYIKDHPEGVSFIQMSNDLEIIPNNLTYITKELVINDDIEKVKGLYYYKSRGSQTDDTSSSVVVWRLDGDK